MRLKKELKIKESILSEAQDEVEERVENLDYHDENIRQYSF